MTHYLLQSIYKVFQEAFDITIQAIAKPPENKSSLLYAKINIIDNNKNKEIIIGMSKEGLVFLSGIYSGLKEDLEDEELEDFIKELSNLIVGKLKWALSDSNKDAKLKVPEIIQPKNMDNYIKKYFKVEETYILLAY